MTSARLKALAARLGIESEFLAECVACGALRNEAGRESRVEISPLQAARLRRLQRLCRGLDIDVLAGCIIVDLLDGLDALRRELEGLREGSAEAGPPYR